MCDMTVLREEYTKVTARNSHLSIFVLRMCYTIRHLHTQGKANFVPGFARARLGERLLHIRKPPPRA